VSGTRALARNFIWGFQFGRGGATNERPKVTRGYAEIYLGISASKWCSLVHTRLHFWLHFDYTTYTINFFVIISGEVSTRKTTPNYGTNYHATSRRHQPYEFSALVWKPISSAPFLFARLSAPPRKWAESLSDILIRAFVITHLITKLHTWGSTPLYLDLLIFSHSTINSSFVDDSTGTNPNSRQQLMLVGTLAVTPDALRHLINYYFGPPAESRRHQISHIRKCKELWWRVTQWVKCFGRRPHSPLWRAMDKRCWNKCVVSLGLNSVTIVMRLPISWVNLIAMLCHVPAVSMTMGY